MPSRADARARFPFRKRALVRVPSIKVGMADRGDGWRVFCCVESSRATRGFAPGVGMLPFQSTLECTNAFHVSSICVIECKYFIKYDQSKALLQCCARLVVFGRGKRALVDKGGNFADRLHRRVSQGMLHTYHVSMLFADERTTYNWK